jgi:hypothetical protein
VKKEVDLKDLVNESFDISKINEINEIGEVEIQYVITTLMFENKSVIDNLNSSNGTAIAACFYSLVGACMYMDKIANKNLLKPTMQQSLEIHLSNIGKCMSWLKKNADEVNGVIEKNREILFR